MTGEVNAKIVPYVQGARWLAEGWRLFKVAPLGWFALVLAYWMLMTLVSLVPVAGPALASVLVPPFSVGFMSAARAAAAGDRLLLGHLFAGFQARLAQQLTLGVIYAALLAALLGASALADGGSLARWLVGGVRPDDAALASNGFLAALCVSAALYLPVTLMYWFAPLLVAWNGLGVAKSLFYSFFACLLNWRAFLAYGALTVLVAVVLPFVVLTVLLVLTGGASATTLMFPLILVVLPTLFASFYASYRGVFEDSAEPAPPVDPA